MKIKLSSEERKILKYQTRPGFVVGGILMLVGIIFAYVSFTTNNNDSVTPVMTLIFSIIIPFLIGRSMMKNYLKDLEIGYKLLDIKVVQAKEKTKFFSRRGEPYFRYDIIVDDTRIRVDKKIYDNCKEGEEIFFHIAPFSEFRLKISISDDIDYDHIIY